MELLTDVTVFKHRLWGFEYADRMEEWFNGLKQAPIRIDAELHTRCNLNCRMCGRRDSNYEKLTEEQRKNIELSAKKWIKIAEESGKMGVRTWNISGLCEPLVKPEVLFPTMKMIKAYNMFGELTTNGSLWNENFVKDTVEMGWNSVCISIDSADPKIHNYLRGAEGVFKKATRTLKMFSDLKKKFEVELPVLTINVVLNKLNYQKLDEIIDMCYNLGGDAVFVEPIVIFGKEGEELKMSEKEIDKFQNHLKEVKEKSENYGIVLDVTAVAPGKAFSGEKRFDESLIRKTGNIKDLLISEAKNYSDRILSIPCYYPWFFLMIRGDGNIIHCGEWKEKEENIRNKNLGEVWFGETFSNIRESFTRGDLSDFCERCRPNVIEDTRIVRKSIMEFRNIDFLRRKYIEFLEENKRVKQELYRLKREGIENGRCVNCIYKKEIEKFKNSLTFKTFSKFWNTPIEKKLKKVLNV